MPARSEAQQKAADAALAAKRGRTTVSSLRGASRDMCDSMTEEELEEIAATPHGDIPARKECETRRPTRPVRLIAGTLTPGRRLEGVASDPRDLRCGKGDDR